MSKYAAFLRGINLGSKNKISMQELKQAFEESGFTGVATYLNSGNIVFEADYAKDVLRKKIEQLIIQRFYLDIPVCIVEFARLNEIISAAPEWWGTDVKSKYDNLIFILSDDSPQNICTLIGEPSQNLEKILIHDNVIFWTFDRNLYQKCNWWKRTGASGIAEKLTIRTAGTVKKLCK